MSLFGAFTKDFFKIKKTINDSFFGKMKADSATINGRKINYFSCKKPFLSNPDAVNITVYNNSTFPSEQQKEVCKKLLYYYEEITTKINNKFTQEYGKAYKRFNITDINNGFKLEKILIHDEESSHVYWDLKYICPVNKIQVDVNFIGENIYYIDIDSL